MVVRIGGWITYIKCSLNSLCKSEEITFITLPNFNTEGTQRGRVGKPKPEGRNRKAE